MTDLIVDALAVFRLSRLIVVDDILETPREAFIDWAITNQHHRLRQLIGCAWCVSPWLAVGVVVLRRHRSREWDYVARTLAFSAVAGALSTFTEH